MWNPTVKKVVDREPVAAATLNPIITALADRDQFLYERTASFESKSVLLAYDLLVDPEADVAANDIVYYKPDTGLNLAKMGFDSTVSKVHFTPINNSFAIGIVKQVYTAGEEAKADVYLMGIIELDVASLMVAGETFVPGPLYLSKADAGKLTATPGGLTVYIGYAIDSTHLFLHPNYDSLNQLFFNYRFELVNRPTGVPELDDDVWTIPYADNTKVGWTPAATSPYAAVAPPRAKFFYNLPVATNINADVTLSSEEKVDAVELRQAFPPYPHHFSMVFVNGILQQAWSDVSNNGAYIIDSAGLWWCDDTDGNAPWPVDLLATSTVTFNSSTDKVLRSAHGLSNGDKVSFMTSGTLPNNVVIVLQFVKLNPDYKASVVTSLKPYVDDEVDTGSMVEFRAAGLPTAKAITGDLLLKLKLKTSTSAETPITNQAVKSVSFNNLTGELEVLTGSVITGVVGKQGVNANISEDGVLTLTLTSFALAGPVEDVEPEDSEYIYKGLHSYLRLKNPQSNSKVGLTGKIRLPGNLPANKNLKLSLLAYGSTSSNNNAKFRCEYSISAAGTISDAVLKTNNGNDISVGPWVANTAAEITNSNFEIPAAALKDNCIVNFRISRVYSADYTGDVNVLGITWSI
ncbi:MAG: hypothetical protein EBU46_01840 [Nitrosomonadaceae bacterium]|nr:hypothetical protein [Nitrosomonadaceae bacterium]